MAILLLPDTVRIAAVDSRYLLAVGVYHQASQFLLVVAIGIIGYMVIEGWSFLDALYMTVITISTVGYKEVADLSAAGRVRGG